MAAVELSGVAKRYEGHRAVEGLTLSVASGECLALLGPSGCGKTTTLNMIAGFLAPDAGEIRIGGRSMQGVPPHRRNLGMVFQHYALFPHLDVLGNLAFGLRVRGVPRAEIGPRVSEALALVRLSGLERRYPRELSGGQQQRVALARALVTRPAVLLLDEPLSNLDAALRQEMRLEILDLQRRLAITTIFVTHDQEEALTIAGRVAVMNAGALEQLDVPRAIYDRPRTGFVARFMGEANVLPGRVAGAAGGRVEVQTDAGPRVIVADERSWRTGDRVQVMVRPEKVRLAGAGAEAADNAHPVTVRDVNFLGSVSRLTLTLGTAALVATTSEELAVEPGATLTAWWRAADGRLLPEERATS